MYGESSNHANLGRTLQDQSSEPNAVSLIFLKEITNNFSTERVLGTGGSAVVYKGVLQNGEIIAVKRLKHPSMESSRTLFENEVDHLMRLKHPNIVRLRGYCHETQRIYSEYQGQKVFAEISEMLICFEYIPKGSLDRHLSGGSSEFDWHTRYKIIEGICNGLHHLHEQIDKSILHLDLKPANVLLDDNLDPKITDFGTSRQFDQRQTISTPDLVGTLGYMAPEHIDERIITPKLDIFSLGATIVEIIAGQRHNPGVSGTSSEDFIELELKKWRNRLEKAQGYTNLEIDCEQIKGCIQIGLKCMNREWTERPTTTKIIKMLQELKSSDRTISNEVESSADQSNSVNASTAPVQMCWTRRWIRNLATLRTEASMTCQMFFAGTCQMCFRTAERHGDFIKSWFVTREGIKKLY